MMRIPTRNMVSSSTAAARSRLVSQSLNGLLLNNTHTHLALSRTISTSHSIRSRAQIVRPIVGGKIPIDSTTLDLLDDLHLGASKRNVPRAKNIPKEGNESTTHRLLDVVSERQYRNSLAERSDLIHDEEMELNDETRDERRSPAAIFATKRIGMVVLPYEMTSAIQTQVDSHPDRALLRQSYLSTLPINGSNPGPRAHQPSSLQQALAPPSEKPIRAGKKNAITPLSALVSAVTDLPGEFAAVKNVLAELEGRLGEKEMAKLTGATSEGSENKKKWMIWDGGVGSGVWAALETLESLPSQRSDAVAVATPEKKKKTNVVLEHVQSSRYMSEMTKTLTEDLEIPSNIKLSLLHGRDATLSSTSSPPSVLISTFQLSKIPTTAARATRVKEIWDSGADTMIIIDKGGKDGFRALAEARAQLLSLGRKTRVDGTTISDKKRRADRKSVAAASTSGKDDTEVLEFGGETFFAETSPAVVTADEVSADLNSTSVPPVGSHVVAPCPHDGVCPLAATKDICQFSQRIQSPRFLRKTKHSSRGEDGMHYSYVVIRRGKRPSAAAVESEEAILSPSRIGAVGKEELIRERRKSLIEANVGKIVPVVGAPDGSYEVIRQLDEELASTPELTNAATSAAEEAQQEDLLRLEAYNWPRLVYPPLKRSGHVVMDTCHPSSAIVRLTLPKSQSRQAYYDARKISWGDLFPHAVKGTPVVRNRGFSSVAAAATPAHARAYSSSTTASDKPNDQFRKVTHPDDHSPAATLDMIADHSQYLLNTYARAPILFTHGKGCKLYSSTPTASPDHGAPNTTREYLDFTAGIAVNALGHGDAQIAALMKEQQEMLSHSSNVCWNEWAGELAKLLVENTRAFGGMGLSVAGQSQGQDQPKATADGTKGARVFFSNSGTEANEGALKFARKYGKEVTGGHKDKTHIVCFNNAFHGRSMGALSVTPNPKYQDPFAPLIPNIKVGDINDFESINQLVDDNVCGVIIEPIQGEGGLNAPSDEWLIALAKRAREVNAVLIHDEIQCGLFRTGTMWAHGHLPLEAQPDIVTMAKPLANGYPIGAILVRDHVAEKVTPGSHGTTFGGQVLGTRIGAHVIGRISAPEFIANMNETAEYLGTRLDRIPSFFPDLISGSIRGRGLMRGIPFIDGSAPGELVKRARERGVLLLTAGSDAVRIIPSLNVSKDECDHAIDVVESCLVMMREDGWGKNN